MIKSFHIKNCESLESIEIGGDSFSDYSGEFELYNLSKLQSIIIGNAQYWSSNFYYSSFVVRGNGRLEIAWKLDLPNLQTIELGGSSFCESQTTIIEGINTDKLN